MISFKWNDFDFTVMQFGKGIFEKNMAGHSHSKNSYELHLIVGGEGILTTDTKSYQLSEGDFFVTGPNIYHQQSTNPENPLQEIFIYLQASERKTKNSLVSTFLATHFHYEKNCRFKDTFIKILEEDKERKWGYTSNIGALMQYLLTKITRCYWPDFNIIEEESGNLNDRRFILIEQAFINDPEGITLSKLSGIIGLCERQTQRLLQKYYDKSFMEKKAESKSMK